MLPLGRLCYSESGASSANGSTRIDRSLAKPNDGGNARCNFNTANSLETDGGSRPAGRGEVGTDVTSPLERKRKARDAGGLTLDCFPNRRLKGYEQSFLDFDKGSFRYGRYSCRGINDGHFAQGRQTKFQASGQVAVCPPTSLDNIDISRHGQGWSTKQRRYFQRLLSGIKAAEFRGEVVRFLTLTSSSSSDVSELNKHCEHLVKRIRRGYFLSEEERRRRKYIGKIVRFEYCKVATNEGYGVLHIIYLGEYIPQEWLSRTWKELHGAEIVYVERLYGGSKGIARYLATQYLSLQNATYTRISYSSGWVCRGFVKRWRHLWEVLDNRKSVLEYWECLLRSKSILARTRQLKLACG